MESHRLHPTLMSARSDMTALGLRLSNEPLSGGVRYLLLGGRSNARWWLIPLVTRRAAASGFALFQPQLPSARALKVAAVAATFCALPLMARRSSVWSVVGQSALARYFPETQRPVFAYFTGTDGPHRKIAVQVMDENGTILGYAKGSTDTVVHGLIAREAEALEHLQRVGLRCALLPLLRFAGEVNGLHVLVTDTRKTVWSTSDRTYGVTHRAFLEELFHKTRQLDGSAGGFAVKLSQNWHHLRSRVEQVWRERIDMSIQALYRLGDVTVPVCLEHGDFTPWNTYRVGERLYVFDWEYADSKAAAGGDAIHFIHSQPYLWRADARSRIAFSQAELRNLLPEFNAPSVHAMHLVYALTQTLRVIEKVGPQPGSLSAWDGSNTQAALLDQLITDYGDAGCKK